MPSPPRRTPLRDSCFPLRGVTVFFLSVLAAGAAASGAAASTTQVAAPDAGWQRALLDRYCVACHNDRLRTADLALDRHDHAVRDLLDLEIGVAELLPADGASPRPSHRAE